MKNILILFLLLFAVSVNAQIINDNTDVNTADNVDGQFLIWQDTAWINSYPTVPGFPYIFAYEKNIAVDSNITTINNFTSGVTSYDAATNSLRVIGTGTSRGAEFQYTHIGSEDYTVIVDVQDVGSGINVYSQWAEQIGTLTTTGKHIIDYTSPASPGAFGAELVLTTTIADTFYINSVTIYRRDADAVMYTPNQIDSFLSSKQDSIDAKITEDDYFNLSAGMYYNTFNTTGDDTRLVSAINATKTLDVANNALDVTTTSGADFLQIGEQPTKRYSYQHIYFDVSNLTDTIYLSAGQASTDVLTITTDGIYERMFYFDKAISGVLGTNRFIVTAAKSGVSYQINEFKQAQFPDIRKGLYADESSGTEAGIRADADDENGVAVGKDAFAKLNSVWGGAGGPERTAVGETSKSLAWRGTAIGGNAYAGSTSSTAIGAGATALQTHSTAIGRGAYVPRIGISSEVGTVIGGDLKHDLFIANSWGHQFNRMPSDIGLSSYATPSTNEVKLHGHDALDAREECWDAGTSYVADDWVQDANIVYKSLTSNLNSTPASNPSDWQEVYATTGGCQSDYNVDAGDIGIYSGKATGTGESGSINMYVAEGNNGQNTKDTPKKALELRSDEAATTGTFLWLLNEATGTMQRVIIDTKPAVSGTNGIVGFSKGYRPE